MNEIERSTLAKGYRLISVKIGNKYENTNQFLMLMKPPIDPNILLIRERNAA